MTKLVEPIKSGFAKAMHDAGSNPEAQSEVLETLLTSVSMCAATMGKGNPALINELLEGASSYLFERATGYQKFGAFMAATRDMPKR